MCFYSPPKVKNKPRYSKTSTLFILIPDRNKLFIINTKYTMPHIYHNRPLTSNQQITIIGYVVEVYAKSDSNNPKNDGKTTKIFRYSDSNPIIARQKAFKRLLIQDDESSEDVGTPGIAEHYKGLKLCLEYHENYDENIKEEPPTKQRIYLVDGEEFNQTRFLERLEEEMMLLMLGGATFNTVSVEGDDGVEYEVVKGELGIGDNVLGFFDVSNYF